MHFLDQENPTDESKILESFFNHPLPIRDYCFFPVWLHVNRPDIGLISKMMENQMQVACFLLEIACDLGKSIDEDSYFEHVETMIVHLDNQVQDNPPRMLGKFPKRFARFFKERQSLIEKKWNVLGSPSRERFKEVWDMHVI